MKIQIIDTQYEHGSGEYRIVIHQDTDEYFVDRLLSLFYEHPQLLSDLLSNGDFQNLLKSKGYEDIERLKKLNENIKLNRQLFSIDSYGRMLPINMSSPSYQDVTLVAQNGVLQSVDIESLKESEPEFYKKVKAEIKKLNAAAKAKEEAKAKRADKRKQKELEKAKKLLEKEGLLKTKGNRNEKEKAKTNT